MYVVTGTGINKTSLVDPSREPPTCPSRSFTGNPKRTNGPLGGLRQGKLISHSRGGLQCGIEVSRGPAPSTASRESPSFPLPTLVAPGVPASRSLSGLPLRPRRARSPPALCPGVPDVLLCCGFAFICLELFPSFFCEFFFEHWLFRGRF